MESYKRLKEEIDALQSQREELQLEKEELLKPLYEIERTYKMQLEGILPKNINSTNSKVLNMRIEVFEAELLSLDNNYDKKQKYLNIISQVKKEIARKSNEQEIINSKMMALAPTYEKRKNFILEIIEKINIITKEIENIQNEIDKHQEFLNNGNWSQSVIDKFNIVINEYTVRKEEKELIYRNLISDPVIAEDVELLSEFKILPEVLPEDVNIKNETKLEPEINIKVIPVEEKILEETYVEKFEEENHFSDIEEIDYSIEEEVSEELKEEVSEEPKEEVFEEEKEEFEIEDKYENPEIEKKVKTKSIRIKQGLSNLALKMSTILSKIVKKPESRIIKKTRFLYDRLIYIKNNYFEYFNELEQKKLLNIENNIKMILEREFDEERLVKLQELNDGFEEYIDNLEEKIETGQINEKTKRR